MPQQPYVGDVNDSAVIRLNGVTIANVESYEVNVSVLTQPSASSFVIGTRGNAVTILKQYPPNTPYQVSIGDAIQQTGLLDEPGSDGTDGSGTVITLRGRDMMAPLHDGFMPAEKSFQNASYTDLAIAVRNIFDVAGSVSPSNDANRRVMTGSKSIVVMQQPRTAAEIVAGTGNTAGSGVVARVITSRIGDRGYQFLKRHNDRAGLFFWATATGDYVLSSPNVFQKPLWKIVRRRGQTASETAILAHSYRNGSQPPRYSECNVYTRAAGRAAGRGQFKGTFADTEMQGWGINRPLVIRDVKGTSADQATLLARRKLAEGRRQVRHFSYTFAGHSYPTSTGANPIGGPRAVWSPDCMVEVQDDEIGVYGQYWIEECSHRQSEGDGTTTTIKLQPPADLFYGDEEDD